MKGEGGKIEELTLELDVARMFFAEEEEEEEARVVVSLKDVTKRKQAEKELRESEERYRSLVRGIVDAVILVDIKGKILLANDMALVTLRKPESRIVNRNLIEALPAKPGKALSAAVKKVVKTKKSTIHVDWVNQHYLELVIAPTLNQEGKVISVTIVGRDLSERKLVETSLQEAFSIINRSPSVAFTWRNSEGWPVEFDSETVKTLFGYRPEEFTSGSVSYAATIHPDDLERVAREVAAYSREKGRRKFNHEPYRIVTKAGEVRWVDDWTFITRDKSGKITHCKRLVTDVTKQKQIEESLRKSEEKYREIFDNANDVIVYVDKWGILLDVNRKAASLFGYKKSDVVGKHFTKLGVVGVKDLPKIVKIFRSVVRGGKHIPMMEMAATDRKGRKLFIEVSTRLLKEKGRLKGFLSIIRDITERKQTEQSLRESENRFRELADALPEIVFEIDREGNVTFANKIAFKVFGYTRSDINKGLNAFQLLAPEFRAQGLENIRKIFGGKDVGPNEYLAQKKDGSTFPAIIHSKAIIDGKEISGLRGVVIDITARKKAEKSARFKKLAETLIRVQEEERKRIARDLHDEIGQDLTAIKLTLGMIKKDYPRLNKPLQKELQEASKLVDITMTNVRRISTRMRPEALDELGLIPCLQYEIRTISERSGIKIELELGNFKARTTPQKETIIYRIVQESLTNIVKHSRASEAEVRLSRGKRTINLKIRDNGRGFDTASLSNSQGLGILGISERLVSVNGELKLESSPGEGTVLDIQIPV